jgi:hypothetical protein
MPADRRAQPDRIYVTGFTPVTPSHALDAAMFSLDASNRDYVRIDASGRLMSGDYDVLEPAMAAALERRGGRAPLLLDLRGWRGWTAGGLLRDLRFDFRHRESHPRIAVVGDRPWHKWLTLAAKPVFTGTMLYFDAAEEVEAVKWVAG